MVATFDENHPTVFAALRERSRHLANLTLIEGATRDEVEALFRAARVYVLSYQPTPEVASSWLDRARPL